MPPHSQEKRRNSSLEAMLRTMDVQQFFTFVEAGDINAWRHDAHTNRFRTSAEQTEYIKCALREAGLKDNEISEGLVPVFEVLQKLDNIDESKSKAVVRAERRRIYVEAMTVFKALADQYRIFEDIPSETETDVQIETVTVPDKPQELSLEDFRKGIDLIKSATDPADFETTPLYKALSERYGYVNTELEELGFVSVATEMLGEGDEAEEVVVGYQMNDAAAEKLAPEEIEFTQAFFDSYAELSNKLTDAVSQSDINYQRKAHEAWVGFFELSDAATSDLIPSLESQFKPNVGTERMEGEPYVSDWTDADQVGALHQYYQSLQIKFGSTADEGYMKAKDSGVDLGTRIDGYFDALNSHLKSAKSGEFDSVAVPARKSHFARAQEILIHFRDVETPLLEKRQEEKQEAREKTKAAVTKLKTALDKERTFQLYEDTSVGALYHYLRKLRRETGAKAAQVGVSINGEAAKVLPAETLAGVPEFRQKYAELTEMLNTRARVGKPREGQKTNDVVEGEAGFSRGELGKLRKMLNELNRHGEVIEVDVDAKLRLAESQKSAEVHSGFIDSLPDEESESWLPSEDDFDRNEPLQKPQETKEEAEAEPLDHVALRIAHKRIESCFPCTIDWKNEKGPFFEKKKRGRFGKPQSIAETPVTEYIKNAEAGNSLVRLIRELETSTGLSYKDTEVEAYICDATLTNLETNYSGNHHAKIEEREKRIKDATEEFKKIKVPPLVREKQADAATKAWKSEVIVPADVKSTKAFAFGRAAAFGASKVRGVFKNLFG